MARGEISQSAADAIFARDNAWDHELEATVLAAALNVGNFAAAASALGPSSASLPK